MPSLIQIALSLVFLLLVFIGVYPYFSNVSVDQGFWFNSPTHLALSIGLLSLAALFSLKFPYLRQFWKEKYTAEKPAELYWEGFFLLIFIPLIASVPLAHGLNQAFDPSSGENLILEIDETSFKRRGVLETRRCHIIAHRNRGESLRIKFRPINGSCQFDQGYQKVSVIYHPGLFNKGWVSGLKYEKTTTSKTVSRN